MKKLTDPQLAHALARIGLGINIFLHGLTRIPRFGDFSAHLQQQFEHTILPAPLVHLTACGIVGTETIVGALLLLGLFLRPALVAGQLLMFVLLFGTCLIQDFTVAVEQLVYLAFYAVLLGTLGNSALSLDAYYQRRADRF